MHSSRGGYLTTEGCLPGVVSAWESLPRGRLPRGGVHLPPPLPVDRMLDTRLWKHYLSATSFADDKNACQ